MNIFQRKLEELSKQHPYVDGVKSFYSNCTAPQYSDQEYQKEWLDGYLDAKWLYELTNA